MDEPGPAAMICIDLISGTVGSGVSIGVESMGGTAMGEYSIAKEGRFIRAAGAELVTSSALNFLGIGGKICLLFYSPNSQNVCLNLFPLFPIMLTNFNSKCNYNAAVVLREKIYSEAADMA